MIVDYASFLSYVVAQASPHLSPAMRRELNAINLEHYAQTINVNLPPKERVDVYLDTNTDRMLKTVAAFGARVVYRVGFTAVRASLPVVSAMSTRWALSLVLSLLLDIIAIVLLFLSGVLVYSLLGVDVQRRTLEMGVLRLLGARRRSLVVLMLAHAAAYALPSLCTALIVAQCLMPIVAAALELLSGVQASGWLAGDALWRAVVVGLAVPGLAAILPISRALQTRVAAALGSDRAPVVVNVVHISRSEVVIGHGSCPILTHINSRQMYRFHCCWVE
jgi:hypothetical protein